MTLEAEGTLSDAEARTERLLCRRPFPGDAHDYRELLLDDQVAAWLRPPPLPPFREGEPEALLRRDVVHWESHGFGPWTLVDREHGRFIGRAGLAWTQVAGEEVVELPWALLPGFWNRGLATEAAQAALEAAARIGIPEVVSLALLDNTPSRRVMEKAGLTYDGEVEHVGLPHALYRVRIDRLAEGRGN
jgi:ribosomal-protein-alanine N-acetyltransferase